MQLSFDGRNFNFKTDYKNRHIARDAGFYWEPDHKIWTCVSVKAAARLSAYADSSAKNELDRYLISVTPWTGRILHPPGTELKDYQEKIAIPWALERNRSYLRLDAGLGKTICAACIVNTLGRPAVYICPAFIARDAQEKLSKWLLEDRSAVRFDSKNLDKQKIGWVNIIPDSIVSREDVETLVELIVTAYKGLEHKPILFIDEAHRFNNASALRTKKFFKSIYPLFDRVIFMSGTSMKNRPMDLYNILSKAAPETIGFRTKFEYGLHFCGGKKTPFGWDFSGKSNWKELRSNVREKFMLVLNKKDVLKELSPKTKEAVLLSNHLPSELLKMEKKILREYSPKDLLKKLASNGHVGTYRKELGKAKIKSALAFLNGELENGSEKFLVFCIHKEVAKLLEEGLSEWKPIVVTGSTDMTKRHASVQKFQKDKRRRVFIGNIDAAGTGLDLYAATRVVFVEFAWVPAANSQAEDRAHRYGQTENVHIQYLVFEDSLDRRVLELVLEKEKITSHF